MKRYVAMRLLVLVPVWLGVSCLCFSMLHFVPGNIVEIMAGDEALDPKIEAKLLAELNLDKPIWLQYAIWLSKVVRGDFGTSWASRLPVMKQIVQRLPVNVELLIIASVFMVTVGILLGIVSAALENSGYDYGIRVLAILGYCIPNFWLATIFVLLGSLVLPWLPVLDYVPFSENPWQNIVSMIIPGLVVGLASLSYVVRMTRSSFLENMRQDYVRTARAKGLPEELVFFRHIMKNSLIPVVTVVGIQISHIIGGFVLTEEVFVLPGIGRLILDSILRRDFPVITTTIMLIATIVVIANLLVDIIYGFLDPRIRY